MSLRWPFMLRSTHERIVARTEKHRPLLEMLGDADAYRLSEQEVEARWQQRLDEILTEVRKIAESSPADVARFNAEFFPAPAERGKESVPDTAAAKAAATEAKEPTAFRVLTGDEIVARAEAHRRLHRRTK